MNLTIMRNEHFATSEDIGLRSLRVIWILMVSDVAVYCILEIEHVQAKNSSFCLKSYLYDSNFAC